MPVMNPVRKKKKKKGGTPEAEGVLDLQVYTVPFSLTKRRALGPAGLCTI